MIDSLEHDNHTIKLSQRIFGKDLVNEIWIIDFEF